MPKTPPLILPTSLPGNWVARSKIKKNKPNIFIAQNKQISFDSTDELHFLSSPSSYNGYSSTCTMEQQQQDLVSKINIPSFEEHATRNTGTITEEPNGNKQQEPCPLQHPSNNSSSQPMNSSSQPMQSSQQQQKTSSQPSQDPTSIILDKIVQENHSQQEERVNIQEENVRSMEQLESLSFASQDLGAEFQKYMEEYRQIKKSIEDKKRELLLYTEDRMRYLDQRQAYFQKQLKILRGYI